MGKFEGQNGKSKNVTDDKLAKVELVSTLYRQGLSYREIAEETGYSRSEIGRMMKFARNEWRRRATKSYATHLYEQLAKFDQLEREAWEGWQRSQLDHVETTTDDKQTPDGVETSVKVRRFKQSGDSNFLRVIESCIKERCKLLGLLDPETRNTDAIEGEVQVVSIVIESREEAASLTQLDFNQFSRLIQSDPVPIEGGV